MRILEEFWYGNIEPTEYDTSSKEYVMNDQVDKPRHTTDRSAHS